MLFRSTIYAENIENLTYIVSTKNPGYPHFLKKKTTKKKTTTTTGIIVSRGQKYFAHTGTHTQKKTMKSYF